VRLLAALILFTVATALPAEAQIYTWRDASGQLVLSNRPRGGGGYVSTYVAPGMTAPRAPLPTHYDEVIRHHASRHGLSPDLVKAVIKAESNFNRYAVSPKGAMGLMQLMPATARSLGVEDPFHPEENIRGGVSYLAALLARYDHNVELALAAYNAGPGAVERYGAIPPYRETRDYVRKITNATGHAPASRSAVIYRWTTVVDGREIKRYSNIPPKDVPFEIVGK
jgi:soluble lytic murein transglycosylase-like protein